MFLYNSENPKIISSGSQRTWRITELSESKTYFAGLDKFNNIYISNTTTGSSLLNERLKINGINFTYLNGPFNFDMKFGTFGGFEYLAIARKIFTGNNVRYHNTIYKLTGNTATVSYDYTNYHSIAYPSGLNHETLTTVLRYANGFSFLGLKSETTKTKIKIIGSKAFDAISNTPYTKMSLMCMSININSSFSVSNSEDTKLGGVLGDLVYSKFTGNETWCRMNHSKQIGNLFISRNPIYSGTNRTSIFSISYLLRYRTKEGYSNGSSSNVREYNTTCASLNGVFSINSNGTLHTVKPIQMFSYIKNRSSIPSNSIFTSFSFNKLTRGIHTIWDNSSTVCYITGDNPKQYNKFFYNHIYNSYSDLGGSLVSPDVSVRIRFYTGKYKHSSDHDSEGYGAFFTAKYKKNSTDYTSYISHGSKNGTHAWKNGPTKTVSGASVVKYYGISGRTDASNNHGHSENWQLHVQRKIGDGNWTSIWSKTGSGEKSFSDNRTITLFNAYSLGYDYNKIASVSKTKLTFTNFPHANTDTVNFRSVIIDSLQYVVLYSTINHNYAGFAIENELLSHTNQIYPEQKEISLGLTVNNFSFDASTFHLIDFSHDSSGKLYSIFQSGTNTLFSGLDNYESDYFSISNFAKPKDVFIRDKKIYVSFNFGTKKYPILNLKVQTELNSSDYPFSSRFPLLEVKNVTNYFEGKSKNVYGFNKFQEEYLLYELNDDDNFQYGDKYSFNGSHHVLDVGFKDVSKILYFDLKKVTNLKNDETHFCSCSFSMENASKNKNASFYYYLFNPLNNDSLSTSGVHYNSKSTVLPGAIKRTSELIRKINFNIVGLIPKTNYKLIVIPFSGQTDSRKYLNRTYSQITSGDLEYTELDFSTNYAPKMSIQSVEKKSNNLIINITPFVKDPFAKLKYTYHLSKKKWNDSDMKLYAYLDTDSISTDFQNKDLTQTDTFYDVLSDKITLRNLFYDEDPVLLLNFEDVFNKSLVYNNTKTNLTDPNDDLYIPIPFVFGDLAITTKNFHKQGIGFHLANETKPNYSNFDTTSLHSTFDSLEFFIKNYDYNNNAPFKYVSGTFPITYYLTDIINYKIHLLKEPIAGEPVLSNSFDASSSHYRVINVPKSSSDFSSYKKNYLENGRKYSYYIEPVLFNDRTNDEINEMIWDVLRTPTDTTKSHYQSSIQLPGFEYFNNNKFSNTSTTSNSLTILLPTKTDAKNLNTNVTDANLKNMQFRLQVINKSTSYREFVGYYNINEFAAASVVVPNLDGAVEYYVTVNTTVNESDTEPITAAGTNKKLNITTVPDSFDNYDYDFANYVVDKTHNKVTFNWVFDDKNAESLFEVKKFNFNTGLLENVAIDDYTANGATRSVRLSSTSWKDIFANCYLFKVHRVVSSIKSLPIDYIVGLPDILTVNNNIIVDEKNTSNIVLTVKNARMNNFNEYLSYTRLLIHRVAEDVTDADFSWNPVLSSDENGSNLYKKNIFGLKSDREYKFKAIAKWNNSSLFKNNFSNYDLNKIRSSFRSYEYVLETTPANQTSDFRTAAGRILAPSFRRQSPGATSDLDIHFNYIGRQIYVRVGVNDGSGNLDISKPIANLNLRSSTFVNTYYANLVGVPTTAFSVLFKFYSDAGHTTEVNTIEVPTYSSVSLVPRISFDVVDYKQIKKTDGGFDNKFSFRGYATPADAEFTVKCAGISSGFDPLLRSVVYTKPVLNPDTNIMENVKVVDFSLDGLTFGKTYSQEDEPVQILLVDNSNIFLDSYPYALKSFTCNYPLLRSPVPAEPDNIIKDELIFKFKRVTDAFYYNCRVFYKPLTSGAVFETEPVFTSVIRDFSETNIINFEIGENFAKKSGIYKLEVTTLNGDLQPSTYPDSFSTAYTTVMFLKDKVRVPEIRTIKDTSDRSPIMTFDFNDVAFSGRDDEKADYLVMTIDPVLARNSDQSNAYGWYQHDLSSYNAFIANINLSPGSNTVYYKTYNNSTKRFSDVQLIEINYNELTGNSIVPDNIFTNSFYGKNKDGLNYLNTDPKRVITIDDNFNLSKVSYIITNDAGKVMSTTDKTVFVSSSRVENFYIFIDYNNDYLEDGTYYVDFFIHNQENNDKKLLKTSKLVINNKTLPVPKINYDSQAII